MSSEITSERNSVFHGKVLPTALDPCSNWSVLMNLQVLVQKASNARARCGHNIQILQYSATTITFVCHYCYPEKLSEGAVEEKKGIFTHVSSTTNNYSDKPIGDNSSDDSVDKLLIDDSTDDSVEIINIVSGGQVVDQSKKLEVRGVEDTSLKSYNFVKNEDTNSGRLLIWSLDNSTDVVEVDDSKDARDTEKEVDIRTIDGDYMPEPNIDLDRIKENHSDKQLIDSPERSLQIDTDQILKNLEMESGTELLDLLYPEVNIKENIDNESVFEDIDNRCVLTGNKEVKDTSHIIKQQSISLLKLRPLAELQRPIPYINQTCATVVNIDPMKNQENVSNEPIKGNKLVQPQHIFQAQSMSTSSPHSSSVQSPIQVQSMSTSSLHGSSVQSPIFNTNNTQAGLPNTTCHAASGLEQISEQVVTQAVKSIQAGRAVPQSPQLRINIEGNYTLPTTAVNYTDSVHMRQQMALSSNNSMLSSSSQLRAPSNSLIDTEQELSSANHYWNNTVSATSKLFNHQQKQSKLVQDPAPQSSAPITTVRNGRIRKNYSQPGFDSKNTQNYVPRNVVMPPVGFSQLQSRLPVKARVQNAVIVQQRPRNPVKSQLWNVPSFEQVRSVGTFNNANIIASQPQRVWQSQINYPAPQLRPRVPYGLNQSVQYPGVQNVSQHSTGVQNVPQNSIGAQILPQHSTAAPNLPLSTGFQNISQLSRTSQSINVHQFSSRSELVKQIERNNPYSKKQ